VHDIVFKTHPEYFTEAGDWHEILFRKMMYSHAFKKADAIVTVSGFSKKEILMNYNVKKAKICVAGNGWQHYNTVDIDEGIFAEEPRIKKGGYYYYLASLAPNKNLWWILENAKKHPDNIYVLSGKPLGDRSGVDSLPNVICTGYVSDARAKALMKHCKAFLFPSTYEGFGIPPMEALSMGAKAVVGDIESLREIYGESVYYIDCKNPDTDIDELIKGECAPASEVLSRFSWESTAAKIAEILTKDN
jgi:glycosyltransferase involved in cell wall biosynthesis